MRGTRTPSAARGAVLAAALFIASALAAAADVLQIPTRFGSLTLKMLDNRVNFQGQVLFNGHPLHPDVRGNNALYVKQVYHLAGTDAVLFEDEGGEACPYLWYIVTVSPSGAASTPEFGSCGKLLGTAQRGQTVVVRTAGFLGPFEQQAARARASTLTHSFVYGHGVMTEDGKPVPCGLACK